MKFSIGILAVPICWAVISPAFASSPQAKSASAEPSTDAIIYKNAKYGFTFSLPEGWKGYTIVSEEWEATDAQKGVVERGPIVYIRPPGWSKENPRQDIPIMVFTSAQWESVEHGDFFMNGAAIVPEELGQNRKYAFAVSRHVEDSDVAGAKEVNQILQQHPLHPIWSK
jgi:hypothetical protein